MKKIMQYTMLAAIVIIIVLFCFQFIYGQGKMQDSKAGKGRNGTIFRLTSIFNGKEQDTNADKDKEENKKVLTTEVLQFDELEGILSDISIKAYEKIEIAFNDIWSTKNPFSELENNILVIFTSPSGKQYQTTAFWYQDYEVNGDNIKEKAQPHWSIRFTPNETGEWKAILAVKSDQKLSKNLGSFEVKEGNAKGFLRVAQNNPYALEFENKDPLFTIGFNIDQAVSSYVVGEPLLPEHYQNIINTFEKLSQAGANFVRLRMDSWFLPLESSPDAVAGYTGIGNYNLKAAWMIDQIVAAAEKHGITLMLCFENANCTVNSKSNQEANRPQVNFYLKENGGPLSDIMTFFDDADVKHFFMQKLRYASGRWSASPAIGIWQLFNEVNRWQVDEAASYRWHGEIATYLKSIDPYKRPVTTSYAGNIFPTPLWNQFISLADIDIVIHHEYQSTDYTKDWADSHKQYVLKNSNKPIMLGEIGTSKTFRKEIEDKIKKEGYDKQKLLELNEKFPANQTGQVAAYLSDPNGLHIHNGAWASIFTSSVGSLPWFAFVIDLANQYDNFTGISRFTESWRINEGLWQEVESTVKYKGATEQSKPKYRVLTLGCQDEIRIWVQNEENTYFNHYQGKAPESMQEADIVLKVPQAGNYKVQWWDTYQGSIINSVEVKTNNTSLTIPFKGTLTDTAAIIKRNDS